MIRWASVGDKGEILLGRNVVADAFAKRLVRTVTHAHQDHIRGLRSSTKWSLYIVATPVTFEFLRVLGYNIPREKMLALDYGREVEIDGERVYLERARHIAGSAQVVVEASTYRVGYTGDFKMPGTPPLEDLDVLVLDATYGSPALQRRWSEWDALAALIDLIENGIRYGPVYVYGYNGKIQEVMVELRRRGVEYPFLADAKSIELARIAAREYGVNLGDLEVYTGGAVDYSAVVFLHMTRRRTHQRLPGMHITLTGWELRGVVRQTGRNSFNVSFSDHATFSEVLEYVKDARPRLVVVDAYRGRDAFVTARQIERRLGIRALYMPEVKKYWRKPGA